MLWMPSCGHWPTRPGEKSSAWCGRESAPLAIPAVSQHLGVLLECDLIVVRREGTRRLYVANHQAVASLRKDLETFWDASLRRLKVDAEAAKRK